MIISHRHRFIFIHCRKVAGSSITAYLNQFLGPRDIQIGIWKDTLQAGGRPNLRVLGECVTPSGARAILSRLRGSVRKRQLPTLGQLLNTANRAVWARRFPAKPMHPTAAEVQTAFPKEWKEYWKFCFVRNPWDRVVSEYHWANANARGVSFDEFVERLADPDRKDPYQVRPVPADTWSMYTIDDAVVADYIGRFENLAGDMESICARLGLPFDTARFPKLKNGRRNTYRSWYCDRSRQLIADRYRPEVTRFGYLFDADADDCCR